MMREQEWKATTKPGVARHILSLRSGRGGGTASRALPAQPGRGLALTLPRALNWLRLSVSAIFIGQSSVGLQAG
jgi:hypothetical protein